jgi:hypothetical protein
LISDQNENEYLRKIDEEGITSPPLPATGENVDAGIVYAWGVQNVIARQDHIRTEHDPDTVPALFSVYRADYDGMEWIANEHILMGDERTHATIKYECIQSHYTVVGQTPDVTPALWVAIPTVIGEWQIGVAYAIDDEVSYQGIDYICIQSHTATAGWEPPNVPALWGVI